MGGNLEHTVSRGVDDGPARSLVFRPELGDDLGAGFRAVAQHAADAGAADEFLDDLRRKAVGEGQKRPLGDDAHNLPVADDGVLAAGGGGAAAVGGQRLLPLIKWLQALDGAEPQFAEVRNLQIGVRLQHMGDGRRAGGVVLIGVGQRADAGRVQEHQ